MKIQTQAIHGGQQLDPETGAVIPPVVEATTFAQIAPGRLKKGYDYSRAGNPTRDALERCLAALEGGRFAFAHSSGCASMHIVCQLLKPGDVILAEEDLYGGALRLFRHAEKAQGIRLFLHDFSDLEGLKEKISALKPRLLWLETPTNPLLKVIDIEAASSLRDPQKTFLAVDSTFATPALQKPLELGADIVLHSGTKYLGGHSDILSGAIIARREDLAERLKFLSLSLGPALSPKDSSLLLRSLKTLPLRMEAHSQNGLSIAQFLERHPAAERVFYPGLASHKSFSVAKRQMKGGFSGMVSFHIKGGKKAAMDFLGRLQIFTLAESLGAVESLASHPKTMTHSSFSSEGVTDSLIRLSAGLEHKDDLVDDLRLAFSEKGF